jgi:flagellar protein FliO/FliZ
MRRLLVSLLLLAAAAGLAPAARAGDDILYPRGTGPVRPPEESHGDRLNLTVGLLAVGCATAGAWLYWRQRRPGGPGPVRPERRLAIAETRSLGNRQYLLVADYEGRKFLLGVCPGRIDLLTPLDGGIPPPSS